MKTVNVIHCWSAPRSRSTALLYSFEARGDGCVALDEPLYREWLMAHKDSVSRPYLENIMSGTPPESAAPEDHPKWEREKLTFVERIEHAAKQLPDDGVIFCKQMAKFVDVYDFDKELVLEDVKLLHKHLLLIRDPVASLSSWGAQGSVHGNNPTPVEVGIVSLLSIYSTLQSKGSPVAVLDSDELAKNPEEVLRLTCSELGIPYEDTMYVPTKLLILIHRQPKLCL